MGMAGLRHLVKAEYEGLRPKIRVLARDSKRNHRKLAPYQARGVEVIWGNLVNAADVARGVAGADVVLHVGGMVSPLADHYPELTYKVNTTAMRNIIKAVEAEQSGGRRVKVVYIGSVSQYGNRPEGAHWGRTGDPISVAAYDRYAHSKAVAERMLVESGVREWVSLRQTGIMYPGIFMKASDPISFHVPIRGALEWVTSDDSGRLLAAVCNPALPDSFWRRFYNIGGGKDYRLSNYDFIKLSLSSVGCPPPERVFERRWFATRNFHGMWYTDSDHLNDLLHFRSRRSFSQYMAGVKRALPWYFNLSPLAPAWLIKGLMRLVANKEGLGTMHWVKSGNADRVFAAFGGIEQFNRIGGWEQDAGWHMSAAPTRLSHGYDESRPEERIDIEDVCAAARWRGGRCLSDHMRPGDLDTPLEWECAEGHRFSLSPRAVLLGGHWCGECLEAQARDPHALYAQADRNPFLAQIVHPAEAPHEAPAPAHSNNS